MTSTIDERIAALRDADRAFQEADMTVASIEDDGVTLTMTVQSHMLNGAGVVHGGWVFLLADTALAYAATTQMVNVLTTDADIRFHRPGQLGDQLSAQARVVEKTRSTLLIDIAVFDQHGSRLASARGSGLIRTPR